MGVAFPLLQALQRVNKRLLEENPAESLLFDVVVITTDSQQQQQSSRIISSTRHYGNLTLTSSSSSSTRHYGNLTLTISSSSTRHYGNLTLTLSSIIHYSNLTLTISSSTRHYGNLTLTLSSSSTRHYGNLTLTISSSSTRHYGNLTLTISSSTRHYGNLTLTISSIIHYSNLTLTISSSTRHYGNLTLTISSTRHYGNLTLTISSTRHYGLEVSRFCFSSEEDFVESLQKNNVQLFLSTDSNEAPQASQKGVLSALLDRQEAPSEQLRVMFCGDDVNRPDAGPMPASRQAAQNFSAQLGEMRQRFSMSDSPLRIVLVTSHGGRESCGALRTLRSHGVNVDEAYCLAGAPRSPILSVVRPHFLLSDGFSGLED
ncbi:uncharacterized serine-rich protein C215.13-like isoform X2 [Perca fluviatilis]|nr:uncharacterized serine-rich protein C215.13-like isoform X2 [Perca fluviatilis]